MLTEQVAYEHGNDLRRDALAYERVASRAASRRDRAVPGLSARVAAHLPRLHRAPAAIGCEA